MIQRHHRHYKIMCGLLNTTLIIDDMQMIISEIFSIEIHREGI